MIFVRSLGQCVIHVDDTPITPESEVVFALLLYLAAHAGRTLPRRALVDLFWPTAEDLSAATVSAKPSIGCVTWACPPYHGRQ